MATLEIEPEEFVALIVAQVEIVKSRLGINKFDDVAMKAYDAGVMSCVAATLSLLVPEERE